MDSTLRQHDTLLTTLEYAVPLHILDVQKLTPDQRINIARRSAETIAHQGDVLQFGGRRGEAAKAFNDLARGLAIAAYQPGGVTFARLHWCVEPHLGCPQQPGDGTEAADRHGGGAVA